MSRWVGRFQLFVVEFAERNLAMSVIMLLILVVLQIKVDLTCASEIVTVWRSVGSVSVTDFVPFNSMSS